MKKGSERMLKNLDENDILAKMFLLFMALYINVTGLYIVLTDDVKRESTTYKAMSTLVSLNTWGIVFLVVGFLYFFMAFHEGKVKYLLMIVTGSVGAVIFGLYAMASIEVTSVIVVGARYAIVASFNLIIAVLGGYQLWMLKK
jgi:hypothetical protein